MSDVQAIVDRFEIEALRGEFTDAGMMRDYDRFASLFTQDASDAICGGSGIQQKRGRGRGQVRLWRR
jgi:hypothetical protein